MLIKRPLTDEQRQAVKDKDLPSQADRLQALSDFVNYAGLKLLELEEKNGNVSTVQSAVDYTC